jgi:PPE-repeat protein
VPGDELMTVAVDFGVLPPEVNSGLMYAGAGSGPLVAAASAWTGLASELGSAANACVAVLSELTSGAWQGPSAASMAAAAAPYAGWMQATAGHAARAASAAAAAVDAYEAAFAATVPPAAVAANRVQLASLVSTNVFGQNTAAIAATEMAYAEMWAQDAAAMYSYAGASAAAATLDPLHEPPVTTTADGSAHQTAAAAQATSSAASNTPTSLSQLLSTLQTSLQGLASPTALSGATGAATSGSGMSALLDALGLNITAPGSGSLTSGLAGFLNMISGSSGATPMSNFLNSTVVNSVLAGAPYSPAFIGQSVGDMTALVTVLGRTLNPAAVAGGLGAATSSLSAVDAPAPIGLGSSGVLAGLRTGGAEVTASVGNATLVRALSVPPHSAALLAPADAMSSPATALPAAAPTASPVVTAGLPPVAASRASRMVDKAEDEDEEAPIYGFPTKAILRTPAGG